ncbi:energy transducer TonB [Allocoleopsis sp.]|uniref:energy transducer TonB n=1 Tax=Allocoleopsis sp. TaxID=3088169 RepID=UPI002FD111D2
MSLSNVCTQQREKETKQLKSFLAFSLVGSGLLHAALLILGATLSWTRAYTSEAKPIEVVVVEPTQPQEKSVKYEKTRSGSAGGSSILGGRAGGEGGGSSVEGGRGGESRGTRSPLALPFGRSQQPTQTAFPRQSPVSERQGQRSDTGNYSPVIPPKPEPEKPQELAQNPTPTPSSPPKSQANPVKSPVTTANVPSPQKNQQSQEENPLEGIREQPRNLGTQSPNSAEKKVAGAHANSSTNTERERKATGNLGRDDSRGISRGERDRMGEGLGNSIASSTGTGTGTGRGNANGTGTGRGNGTGTGNGNGTGTGRGNGTGTGNGNGNQPGSDSAIATGSVNAKPSSQRNEPKRSSMGSSSRGLICRQCPKPDYPRNARQQDIEGEPQLSFDIDEKGHTINVRIATSSGNEELDQAALEAVQRWRFAPSSSNRQNVNATISFEMKGSQRQRQNRERQQRREESRRNPETVDIPQFGNRSEESPGSQPRQTELEPSSRESTSAPEAAGFGSSNK